MPATAARSPLRVFASVFFALWFRELKTRYAGSKLGWLWALAGPLATVLIFSMIVGSGSRALVEGIDYPVYVLTGLTFYGLVMNSVTAGLNAIDANAGLFIYRQVKPFDVVVARVVQGGAIDLAMMVILLGLGAWLEYQVLPADPLGVLACLAAALLLALGLGLGAAVLGALVPETKKMVPIILRPFFFISGVMFPLSAVPEEYRHWLLWNPLLHLLELMRQAWWPAFPLDEGISPAWVWMIAVIILGLSMTAYRRYRERLVTE